MQRIKIGLGLVALLAMSAIGTGTASAESPKLDLTFDGQQLEPSHLLELTSFELRLTSPKNAANVKCIPSEPTLGADEINDAPIDKILFVPNIRGGPIRCGNFTTAERAELVIGPASPANPWSLILKSSGQAELTSNKTEPMSFTVVYEPPLDTSCRYTSKKLKGSLTLGGPKAMNIFFRRKLKLSTADSSPECPKKATLTWPFVASYDGFFIFDHTEA